MYLEEISTVFSKRENVHFSDFEKLRMRIPPIGYGNTKFVFSDKNGVYNAYLYIRLFAFLGDKTKVYFQVNDKTKLYFR